MAKDLDYRSAASWVGHPYFDVIDNSTDFETKMNRMIECVCQKLGLDTGDRLLKTSRKLKYLGTLLLNISCAIDAMLIMKIFRSGTHARRQRVSRFRRFRGGPPLFAVGRPEGTGTFAQTRPKGPLDIHSHDAPAARQQSVGGGAHSADASRLHESAGAA